MESRIWIASVHSILPTIVSILCSDHEPWTRADFLVAPVLKDVGVKYGEVLYNGSFFHEQIYRKDPGLEVDAAWKALGADCKSAT